MIQNIVQIAGATAVNAIAKSADLEVLRTALSTSPELMKSFCQGVTTTLMPNLIAWVEDKRDTRISIFKAAYQLSEP